MYSVDKVSNHKVPTDYEDFHIQTQNIGYHFFSLSYHH